MRVLPNSSPYVQYAKRYGGVAHRSTVRREGWANLLPRRGESLVGRGALC